MAQTITQLDPTIMKLVKAIRETESHGNYNETGGSGENGAFQFMPDTWKGWAKQYLGDANAPMTPANQNQVAYMKVKELADKGFTPKQVAAAWNGGEGVIKNDKWKTMVGTNKYGVKYDIPSYVNKVMSNAKKVGVPEQGITGLAGVGAGIDKSIASTGFGALELMQSIGQHILAVPQMGINALTGKPADYSSSLKDVQGTTGIDALKTNTVTNTNVHDFLEPIGTAENIGKYGTDIATFFIPGAVMSKVATGSELVKVATTGKIVLTALGDSTIAAIQAKGAGGSDTQALESAFLTGVFSGAAGFIGKAYTAAKAGTVLESLASKIPAGEKTATSVFNKAIGLTGKGELAGKGVTSEWLASQSAKDVVGTLGTLLGTATTKVTDINAAIDAKLVASGAKINIFNFVTAKQGVKDYLTKEFGLVTKPSVIDDLVEKTWDKYAFKLGEGISSGNMVDASVANKIRQAIDQAVGPAAFEKVFKMGGEQGNVTENAVLRSIAHNLREVIKNKFPATGPQSIRPMFEDLQSWIKIKNATTSKLAQSSGKLGLTNLIGGTASIASGNPLPVLGTVGIHIYNDAAVQTLISKLLPEGQKIVVSFIERMGKMIESIPESKAAATIKAGMEEEITRFLINLDQKQSQ